MPEIEEYPPKFYEKVREMLQAVNDLTELNDCARGGRAVLEEVLYAEDPGLCLGEHEKENRLGVEIMKGFDLSSISNEQAAGLGRVADMARGALEVVDELREWVKEWHPPGFSKLP